MVEHMVVDRGAGDPFGAGGSFGGFYGRYTYNNAGSSAQDDNPKVRAAGNFISNGYYNEALKVLEEVPLLRDAEGGTTTVLSQTKSSATQRQP